MIIEFLFELVVCFIAGVVALLFEVLVGTVIVEAIGDLLELFAGAIKTLVSWRFWKMSVPPSRRRRY